MGKQVKIKKHILLLGMITFTIGFTGCVGALRENTCLLACVSTYLLFLLFETNFYFQSIFNISK